MGAWSRRWSTCGRPRRAATGRPCCATCASTWGTANEEAGRREIDKAWVEALTPLLDVPPTDRAFILETLATKDPATLAHLFFHLHFYLVQRSGNGSMTAPSSDAGQLRPGLWATINERYPGAMVTRDDAVPLARLAKPLTQTRLAFVSSAGVQPKGTMPFDVVHPVGDYSFRRVPADAAPTELEIHQLKYPTDGAHRDLNVIFPIERLRELAAEGAVGGLTPSFFSFIGYNMDPERLERTLAEDIAAAVVADGAEAALLCPA